MPYIIRIVLVAAVLGILMIPSRLAVAQAPPRYTLIDLGTFGGSNAALDLPGYVITNQGFVLGQADTTIPDADYPNFNPFGNIGGSADPTLAQAFEWRNGHLVNLGALPGNNGSAVVQVNSHGIGAGLSETGAVDPYTGWPSMAAVLFKGGQVMALGSLPGVSESFACCVTDSGLVAGMGSNGIADPFSFFGTPTQWRSFIWQDGVMNDIGTLGGPDATVAIMNNRGQVTGQSYTNNTPNPATGIPTLDPFLWQNGKMQDLGTLGGTVGFANWMNNHGDVAGTSDLASDQTHHGFLWSNGKLTDLGTLGGDNSEGFWVNDAGDVVGRADVPGSQTHHAYLYKNGRMTDLGLLAGENCDTAYGVNSRDQVIGDGGICGVGPGDPFLWQQGTLYDLQAFVSPTTLRLTEAVYINEQGEIVGLGVLPNGDQHVVLLVPAAMAASEHLALHAPASAAPESSVSPSSGRSPRLQVGPAPRAMRLRGYHDRTA
jgi:probable HAF family extracellular repeat protein